MSNERQHRSSDHDVVAAFRGHWLRFKRREPIRDHPVIHLIDPGGKDTQLVESITERRSSAPRRSRTQRSPRTRRSPRTPV